MKKHILTALIALLLCSLAQAADFSADITFDKDKIIQRGKQKAMFLNATKKAILIARPSRLKFSPVILLPKILQSILIIQNIKISLLLILVRILCVMLGLSVKLGLRNIILTAP